MKIKQMDTTKDGIKPYFVKAAQDAKRAEGSQLVHKLALFRWFCDAVGMDKPEERAELWKQAKATPGWFGTNSSAASKALGFKSEIETTMDDFAP